MSKKKKTASGKGNNTNALLIILFFSALMGWYVWKTYSQPVKVESTGKKKIATAKKEPTQKNAQTNKTPPSDIRETKQNTDEAPQAPESINEEISEPKQQPMSGKVYLTFDAGAASDPIPSILKTLSDNNVKCAFFLTGKFCEKFPVEVNMIGQSGHVIGNHSYAHKDLTKLSEDDIKADVQKAKEIIEKTTGVRLSPLFRFPFGARDKRTREIIENLGYKEVYWNIDSWDAVKDGITSEEILERILSRVKNGDIILMHCGSKASADALPTLIQKLREKGLEPSPIE